MKNNEADNVAEANKIEEIVKNAPKETGVYLMKDANGKVIYVGKAKNIRQRLRSYSTKSDSRAMIPFLVPNVATMEFIITNTEKEALILENNLIKLHRPRYNVFFRDDRSYYSISVNAKHPFPSLRLVRSGSIRMEEKNFGPFPSSAEAKKTLLFLQTLFQIRSCRDKEFTSRKRPCVEYQIKRCCAPCIGGASTQEYRAKIQNLLAFLGGNHARLIKELNNEMLQAASDLNFESARALRDQISSIKNTLERQSAVIDNQRDIDVFGLFRRDGMAQICLMFIRAGKLIGKKEVFVKEAITPDDEIASAAIKSYYENKAVIPDVVLVSHTIEDSKAIGEWLSQKKKTIVRVISPCSGRMVPLKEMAIKNAESSFEIQKEKPREANLQKLAEKLLLSVIPHHIECFDISNTSGMQATGAKVSFIDGLAHKNLYRRYQIKSIAGADDYGMMREVLSRRFASIKEDPLPDLLLIDGGKGHLAVALTILKDCSITELPVIALAKEKNDKQERIYIPLRKNALILPESSPELLLLMRIRDEAHRFAIRYHRYLRNRNLLKNNSPAK
ncbi:MAG: excinuclease ABC subunit UvrC [Deltaproteobacteria bacterium]|nr:excinuclease ABC subunit UvrC [Deltaproteobacteria bacterium]